MYSCFHNFFISHPSTRPIWVSHSPPHDKSQKHNSCPSRHVNQWNGREVLWGDADISILLIHTLLQHANTVMQEVSIKAGHINHKSDISHWLLNVKRNKRGLQIYCNTVDTLEQKEGVKWTRNAVVWTHRSTTQDGHDKTPRDPPWLQRQRNWSKQKQARKRTQYTYIHQNQQENTQKAAPPCGEECTLENNHPGLFPLKLGWAILNLKGKSPRSSALGTRLKLTTQRSHGTKKISGKLKS